jgi:hypothetical protein
MYIPYAYGALYQHPFEMLIMDSLSGLVSVAATGAQLQAAPHLLAPDNMSAVWCCRLLYYNYEGHH